MGLDGSLRAFSVTDIFQMLSLQKKSGLLTVEGRDDTIRVSFIAGQIVSADSASYSLEESVGTLLVRSGKLAPEDLLSAMEARKETRQRLGFLLARQKAVTPEVLQEALRLQICRTILAAFRWTDGRFRFSPAGVVGHDVAELSLPIPADVILTEAVQFLEEWPRLGKSVPSRDLIYRRAAGLENLRLVLSAAEMGEGTLLVSRQEAETWKWVDGKRRVGEILERAFLSDLDVYRGVADLLDRNLIAQAGLEETPGETQPAPRASWISARAIGLWAVLPLLGVLAVREIPRNSWNLFLHAPGERREVADLFKAVSLGRLATIERALRVYYDTAGHYPKSLEDLLTSGVLNREAITDPYGRPYRYILRSEAGKFSLYGRNAHGDIDLDLSFERSLAPMAESLPVRNAKPPDKHPGVRVIQ